MKKISALALALVMALSITSCGKTEPTPAPAPAPDPAPSTSQPAESTPSSEPTLDENGFMPMEESYLTLAAGSNGGGWYIMGAAFNDVWEQNLDVHMTLIPGGGSTNPALVNEGSDVQLGFTYMATAAAATKGQFDYEGAACSDMVALGSLNIKQYLTINSTEDYTSVEEMIANPKSLKIAVGPRAGGNEVSFNRYLEFLGTSLDDLEKAGANVQYISASEGMTGIKDGILNSAVNLAAPPQSNIAEALASVKMSFIGLDEATAQKTCEKYGYGYGPLAAGTYQYQDEDVYTLYDTVILVINKDVDDAVAYNLAKVLAENRDSYVAAYAAIEPFDPAVISECGIDLHPGAQAYYESAGLM